MNEWFLLRRDRALILTWTLFAILCLLAAGQGALSLHRQVKSATEARAQDEESRRYAVAYAAQLNQGRAGEPELFRDPRRAGPVGRFQILPAACLPPLPLESICAHTLQTRPAYWRVSTDLRQSFMTLRELENPERMAAGSFDLEFVLVFLLPLLLITTCYSVLAGDRDQGLLRLLLAQPISATRLLAQRLAWRGGLSLALALLAVLGAATLGYLGSPGSLTGLPQVSLLVGAYTSVWVSLSAWLTTLSSRGATAILRLASLWLVLVIVLPGTLGLAARELFPLPSRIEFLDRFRDESHRLNLERAARLNNFMEDHPEFAAAGVNPDDFYQKRLVLDQELEDGLAELENGFRDRAEAQRKLRAKLAAVSPALLFDVALQESCQADARRFAAFEAQVVAFHRDLRKFYTPFVFGGQPFTAHQSIPRFTFREQELAPPHLGAGWATLGLLAWSVGFLLLTRRALKRVDPG